MDIHRASDPLIRALFEQDRLDYDALRFRYSPYPDAANPVSHRIDVSNPQGAVGYIEWDNDDGTVNTIFVGRPYRRMGIATMLWEKATEMSESNGWEPPQHSDARSEEGDAFAQSIGGYVPHLRDDVDGWSTR